MTFKELRIRSGRAPQEIADALQIKKETYLKYEYSMRLPGTSILAQMLNIYKCTGDDLLNAYNYHKEVQVKRYGKTNP